MQARREENSDNIERFILVNYLDLKGLGEISICVRSHLIITTHPVIFYFGFFSIHPPSSTTSSSS